MPGGRLADRSREVSTQRAVPRYSTRSMISEGVLSDRALGMLEEESQQPDAIIA